MVINQSTIFTKIIKREIPSYIVYEDNLVIAFLDLKQVTKGHTLVVTKNEYIDIQTVPSDVFIHLFKIVQKISKVIIQTFKAKGLNIINNNGHIAGQMIFHYHIHLIPRFEKDEIIFKFKENKISDKDYKEIQNLISINLK